MTLFVVNLASKPRNFLYNAENRLVSVEPETPVDGDKKLEFTYDYMGRRVKKSVYDYSAGSWRLNEEKLFVYDGWNLIEEIMDNGTTQTSRYFVWGLDLSQSLQGAGGIGGLITTVDGADTYYFAYDGNGNVGQVIESSSGTIAASYQYDPFGNLIKSDGAYADDNPFRFSTKYHDDETGLVYYGYRYYSAEMGRWLNRDSLGEFGGINLHHFVFNSPIHWVDYLGQWGDGNHRNKNGDPASRGHSDFPNFEQNGNNVFDYTKEDKGDTSPFKPKSTWRHFQRLEDSEANLVKATTDCNKDLFERSAHQMQDFFSHYGQDYRAEKGLNYWTVLRQGHVPGSVGSFIARKSGFGVPRPDHALDYQDAYAAAEVRTSYWVERWKKCCCGSGNSWTKINNRPDSDCRADAPPNFWGENAPPATPENGYWREGWDTTKEAAEWTYDTTTDAAEWTWNKVTGWF